MGSLSSGGGSSRSRWIQARLLAAVISTVLGLLGEPCDGASPLSATLAAALGRRHASDTPCSLAAVDLEAHGFDVCSVWNAGQAWPPEADGHGHRLLSVGFGENNCKIDLQKCHEDTCYTMFDMTARIPLDDTNSTAVGTGGSAPPSIFSSVAVEGGTLKWTSAGFAFTPTQQSVTIRYSTHTCANFYATRGTAFPQRCSEPVAALTLAEPDIPTDLCG